MLDLFNLPTNIGPADIQSFSGGNEDGADILFEYVKPRGKTMLYIYCVGGGGGGGGGRTGAAGTARGGGGGGGSGGVATLIVPLSLLPDTLYVRPGLRGLGGAANTAGGAGTISYVSIHPSYTVVTNTLLLSNNTGAAGGGAGLTTAGGTLGVGGSIPTIANCPLAGRGLFQFFVGRDGTSGGAHTGAAGTNNSISVTGVNVMGGTGGGGTTSADFSGGDNTIVAGSLLGQSVPIASGAGSNNGSAGVTIQQPFYNFAGLGGGSSNTGVGGNGGSGAYGSGGGGGGGGTTGGTGGDGGNGIVIMIAW